MYPQDLVVSGSGGLCIISDSQVNLRDPYATTGMAFYQDTFYRCIQKQEYLELVTYRTEGVSSEYFIRIKDIHDLAPFQGKLYAVSTGSNEIYEINKDLEYSDVIKFPGEGDAWHLNCLTVVEGKLYCSAFCDDPRHYNYKGRTKDNGFVIDVFSGDILMDGLSQPHSPLFHDGKLFVCNSECRSLVARDMQSGLIDEVIFNGYTRGLHIENDIAYVGLSKSRGSSDPNESARIVLYDLRKRSVLTEWRIPFDEVYEIKALDDVVADRLLSHAYKKPRLHMAKAKLGLSRYFKIGFK